MAPKALIRQPDAVASWDAYKAFSITGRYSRGMNCYGTNQKGTGCAWNIPQIKYDDLRRILDYIETQPPQEAVQYLGDIASLSLCQDFHQNQAYYLVDDWRRMLKNMPYTIATGPTMEEKLQDTIKKAQENDEESKVRMAAECKAEAERYKAQLLAERQTFEVERKRYTKLQNDATDKHAGQLASLETKLGDQLHAARQELQRERLKIQDLEASKESALNEMSTQKERNLEHTHQIKALEFAISLLRNADEQMKAKAVEQEKDIVSKLTSIQELLSAKNALLKDVGILKSELETSKNKIQRLEATAKEAQWSESSLSSRAQALQASLDEEKQYVKSLLETQKDIMARVDKTEAERATLANEVETLAKTNSDLTMERDTLQARLDATESELAAHRAQDNAMVQELHQLELSNADLTNEKATLRTELRQKDNELATRLQESAALRTQFNRLELSSLSLTRENQTLQTRLSDATSELATSQRNAASLTKDVENLRAAQARLAGERETLQTKLGLEEGELSSLLRQLQLSNEQNEAARQRPFRFMTKCWMEKVQRSKKKVTLEHVASREEGSVAILDLVRA